jgi:putative endonuclease
MGDARELGRRGEDAAAEYLTQRGLVVVGRNWRCRHGEIDIVAQDGATLVFCEVKTRRGTRFGVPLGSITAQKCARLRRLAGAYLVESGSRSELVRIDAIGILWGPDGPRAIEHVRGVA